MLLWVLPYNELKSRHFNILDCFSNHQNSKWSWIWWDNWCCVWDLIHLVCLDNLSRASAFQTWQINHLSVHFCVPRCAINGNKSYRLIWFQPITTANTEHGCRLNIEKIFYRLENIFYVYSSPDSINNLYPGDIMTDIPAFRTQIINYLWPAGLF